MNFHAFTDYGMDVTNNPTTTINCAVAGGPYHMSNVVEAMNTHSDIIKIFAVDNRVVVEGFHSNDAGDFFHTIIGKCSSGAAAANGANKLRLAHGMTPWSVAKYEAKKA